MAQASKKMMNLLTEFLICEIGSKSIDGITYAFVLKNDKNKENFERYNKVKDEVIACGFGSNEVFRVYEVSNGYIFDMDLSIAKSITNKLAKNVDVLNDDNSNSYDLIGDNPEKRRKNDMIGLAKLVQKEFKAGNNVVDAALFSRNTVSNINITGKDNNGQLITVRYPSFAVRHLDIETINEKLLMPSGLRIYKLEPIEILPTKTGVLFKLYTEHFDPNNFC